MSVQRSFKTFLVLLLGLFFFWGAAIGYPQSAKLPEVPISITSKSMVAWNTDRTVIFEGDVVLTKGDFTLTTDRLEVTFTQTDSGNSTASKSGESFFEMPKGKEAVSLIEAIGNVLIAQGDRHGKAERAVYDHKDEKVILTGHPEVWEKDFRVSGKKMVFFLREQKNLVEEGKAIVYPQ